MLKTILIVLLPLLGLFGIGSDNPSSDGNKKAIDGTTGTLEKMIVANGSVAVDLDLARLNGGRVSAKQPKTGVVRFDVERDSFFKVLVFNDELRGPLPSAMALIPQNTVALPAKLNASIRQLVVESKPWGGEADLVISDAKTGFVFFNIEGANMEYNAAQKALTIADGRLRISKEFATELGRANDEGTVVGKISITTTMRAIEVSDVVNGEVKSEENPGRSPESGSVPGPDVIVGDLSGLAQFGTQSGTQVGLAVATDSCNFGTENLHWFQNPENDHPVIPQNLYRLSGGATNDERFEQVGQSQVKHAFTALTNNICGLGCNGVGGANLGSGCSDPYSASLNSGPNLGSRAWINPFTGFYPRNDGGTTNNSHTGHTHTGPSHRILTEVADLNTSLNVGASYFVEALYITPHEYAWCQAHAGQCNMNNNVSYRRYSVNGTASPFTFTPQGTTVRTKAAIEGWPGSTAVLMNPAPGVDGIGYVAYKVTQTSPGVWHYEYAVYNQNMDRGIQSFSVPLGNGVTLTNVGFHAPPQHPGWTNDGTVGNAGFSSTPWAQSQAGGAMTWNSETFATNQNANAIRWGTLYNFRFDSNTAPQATTATVGFFKTGTPITVAVQGPAAAVAANFSISGRVLSSEGLPIRNAIVTIDDQAGHTFSMTTGSLGVYGFDSLPVGPTYRLTASAKRNRFTAINTTPTGNVTDFDITANPEGRPSK
jgi:Carboxypeptidase regulatory-like domain